MPAPPRPLLLLKRARRDATALGAASISLGRPSDGRHCSMYLAGLRILCVGYGAEDPYMRLCVQSVLSPQAVFVISPLPYELYINRPEALPLSADCSTRAWILLAPRLPAPAESATKVLLQRLPNAPLLIHAECFIFACFPLPEALKLCSALLSCSCREGRREADERKRWQAVMEPSHRRPWRKR